MANVAERGSTRAWRCGCYLGALHLSHFSNAEIIPFESRMIDSQNSTVSRSIISHHRKGSRRLNV